MLGLKILDIIDQANVPTKQTKRSVVCNCPRPDCQSEFKLYIEKKSGRSICFKCGTKWTGATALSAILNISKTEAENLLFGGNYATSVAELEIELIDQWSFDSVDSEFTENEDDAPLPEIALDPLFVPVEQSIVGMEYLKNRGVIDLELIRKHGVLYSAVMNAVVFVVKDALSRTVGWQSRYITPWNPKIRMMTYSGMQKAKVLYNIQNSSHADSLILVEGPFDCIKADVPGFAAVASLGKIVSSKQIQIILESQVKNVFLGLDRDAYQEVQELAEKIGKRKNVFRITPPENRKDFGECNQNEILEALKLAQPCFPEKTSRLEVWMK